MSLLNLSELPAAVFDYYYECIAEEFLDSPPTNDYVHSCWRGETYQTRLDLMDAVARVHFSTGNEIREVLRKELTPVKPRA